MMHKVKIAVDAMGGENSPKKILKGIQISLESNKENYFYLYGNSNLLKRRSVHFYPNTFEGDTY